ncbi:hypothetical protein DFH08DRAFT_795737 [Mycena albidolilacea]|uniref:Uncharacterized protein n=1 Tax=Mycena albidolilacea TaxID=1033008 RepID=A0AAD7F615_9AGAR|nr:hypothetical protein DFH08DRAFT_795737 [Mycena albidolilacea]
MAQVHTPFTLPSVAATHPNINAIADAEATFNDPNTLQNILEAVLRVEARLDNTEIVKRNRLEVANNSGTTVYVARKKQVTGDGLALATALAPVNPNVNVPPLQGDAAVGAVFHATIETHGMNHGTILGLIRFYNEDFSIAPGDTNPCFDPLFFLFNPVLLFPYVCKSGLPWWCIDFFKTDLDDDPDTGWEHLAARAADPRVCKASMSCSLLRTTWYISTFFLPEVECRLAGGNGRHGNLRIVDEHGNYREDDPGSSKRTFVVAILENSGLESQERPAYNP